MDFTQWFGIAALIVALVVAGVLIYLYKQDKMTAGSISSVAGLIDKVTDVLKDLGQNETLVGVLASYAAKAVRVVEQMVKNGELEKDNEVRKNEARVIVEQLALADGVDIELLYENEHTINNLIEAAVNEMKSPMVVIDQNIGFEEAGTEGDA